MPFQPLHLFVPLPAFIVFAIFFTYLTYRFTTSNPHLRGSGLPQTKASLKGAYPFNPKKDLPIKGLLIVCLNDLGYSIGTTGPAFVLGSFMSEWFVQRYGIDASERHKILPLYGCVAVGLFLGTPLASIALSIEEFSIHKSPKLILKLLYILLIAFATSRIIQGHTITALLPFQNNLSTSHAILNMLLTLPLIPICLLLGWLYKKMLFRLQKKIKPIPGFLISFLLLLILTQLRPESLTSGFSTLKLVISHHPFSTLSLVLIFIFKYVFTLQCASTGMPAGIFVPSLCLGGIIGSLYANILPFITQTPFDANWMILSGMIFLFSSILGLPLTACLLTCEITNQLNLMPFFLPIALITHDYYRKLGAQTLTEELLHQM